MIPEASTPDLLVSLTRPRWVGWMTHALLGIASLAVIMSARAIGLGLSWAIILGVFPVAFHILKNKWTHAGRAGRVLVMTPDQPWRLSFFSKETGLTDSIEVIVSRRWHHFFGISLGLKLQNRPHNKPQTTVVVVWKHGLTQQVFREVAQQSARQLELAGLQSKGDAA